jgi:hypothetical protein
MKDSYMSMSEDEAFAALGLPVGASHAQILEAFRGLSEDYGVRIGNAPTNALKRTYQEKLEQLRLAVGVLIPGNGGVVAADLPAREPVRSESGRFITQPVAGAAPAHEEEESAPERSTSGKAIYQWLIGIATVMLVLAGVRALWPPHPEVNANALEDMLQVSALRGDRATSLAQLPMQEVALVFENATSRAVVVEWYSVIWIDEVGVLRLFHSGDAGLAPEWSPKELARGEANSFAVNGKGRLVSYAFGLSVVGDEAAYYVAGTALDAPDGRYRLTEE